MLCAVYRFRQIVFLLEQVDFALQLPDGQVEKKLMLTPVMNKTNYTRLLQLPRNKRFTLYNSIACLKFYHQRSTLESAAAWRPPVLPGPDGRHTTRGPRRRHSVGDQPAGSHALGRPHQGRGSGEAGVDHNAGVGV